MECEAKIQGHVAVTSRKEQTKKGTTNIAKCTKMDKSGLKIYFQNTQSLVDKLEELRIICHNETPDFVGCVETWLDDSHSAKELEIENYRLFFKNRHKGPNRGGVAMYAKTNMRYKYIDLKEHESPCKCENLWLLFTIQYNTLSAQETSSVHQGAQSLPDSSCPV